MTSFLKQNIHWFVAGALLILLATLSLLSEGYYGGTDNINHYFLSRYAFQYPHLFLDSWGRPLYTILSSPFSQFGFQGTKLFNVLLGVLSAWFAYRIAKMENISPSFLALIFVCFTPIYCVMLITGLTEILFSFVLIASVFLFYRGNYIASAIVISFLPFARTEGYVLIPIFFLALWMRRKYKAWPFLAFGFVFFSILGSFYYKDLFWVVTKFPYPVLHGHPVYKETGDLFHFLQNRNFITGLPLEILFLGGIIQLIRELFSREKHIVRQALIFSVLILLPVLIYLALHSVLYWRAMGGSMGFVRVLAGVLPLAAIVSLKGFQGIVDVFRGSRWLYASAIFLVIFLVARTNFKTYEFPVPLDTEESCIKEASIWHQNSQYAKLPFFFTDLNVPFFKDINAYNTAVCKCGWFFYVSGIYTLPDSAVLIWDSHFGPNECQVPLDTILNNPNLRLIKHFQPPKPWITLGGHKYEVLLMQNLPGRPKSDNYAILDSMLIADTVRLGRHSVYKTAFEGPTEGIDGSKLSVNQAFSGQRSFLVDAQTEYSPGLFRSMSEISKKPDGIQIFASVYIYLADSLTTTNTPFVVSLEHEGKSYSYTPVYLEKSGLKPGQWNQVRLTAQLPGIQSEKDILKVYIWNPGKRRFYMDDLKVDILQAE